MGYAYKNACKGLAKFPLQPCNIALHIIGKANGTAVIDVLKKELSGLTPIEPRGGKVVRAHAVTAAVEAGNVYIPHSSIAPWVQDFMEELSAFPSGANDDQVDAMTQANAYYNDKKRFDITNLIS